MPEEIGKDSLKILKNGPQCVAFGVFIIWFSSITLNLGPTFLSGAISSGDHHHYHHHSHRIEWMQVFPSSGPRVLLSRRVACVDLSSQYYYCSYCRARPVTTCLTPCGSSSTCSVSWSPSTSSGGWTPSIGGHSQPLNMTRTAQRWGFRHGNMMIMMIVSRARCQAVSGCTGRCQWCTLAAGCLSIVTPWSPGAGAVRRNQAPRSVTRWLIMIFETSLFLALFVSVLPFKR